MSKFNDEILDLKLIGLDHDGQHTSVSFILSSDMVFLAYLLGVKRANAKCSCLFCLVYGDNKGDVTLHTMYPPRPLHRGDTKALNVVEMVSQEESESNTRFDFSPAFGYNGVCAISALTHEDLAVERLHLRLNLYKKVFKVMVDCGVMNFY
jgi:hypothetical protein